MIFYYEYCGNYSLPWYIFSVTMVLPRCLCVFNHVFKGFIGCFGSRSKIDICHPQSNVNNRIIKWCSGCVFYIRCWLMRKVRDYACFLQKKLFVGLCEKLVKSILCPCRSNQQLTSLFYKVGFEFVFVCKFNAIIFSQHDLLFPCSVLSLLC